MTFFAVFAKGNRERRIELPQDSEAFASELSRRMDTEFEDGFRFVRLDKETTPSEAMVTCNGRFGTN